MNVSVSPLGAAVNSGGFEWRIRTLVEYIDMLGAMAGIYSRQDLLDWHPTIPPEFIQTAGFTTPGDGGGALYKYLSSTPVDPDSPGIIPITCADGTVVFYGLADSTVNSLQFGAVLGTSDSVAALQAMLDWGKTYGGVVRFVGCGNYRISAHLFLQNSTTYFHIEADPNCWIEKFDLNTHYNLMDIYDCENISLGNLNFNCRHSANPALYVETLPDGTRVWTTDNIGYGLTLRNCSNVSHVGKVRIHDFHDGLLIYTSVTTDPPVYHDVTFDYVELHAAIEVDSTGSVTGGGWAVAGLIMVNMLHSGVQFVDAIGIMTNQPGFAIEFKLDCHECWFNGFQVKQCYNAVSALGTGGGGTQPDARNCWFGPGLVDQCKVALALSHAEKTTFAHVRARHHPDLFPHDLNTPPWFVQVTGNSTDCTVNIEIVDYDGGVNAEPPVYLGGDRNTITVPYMDTTTPKYATIAGGSNNCHVAVLHDVKASSTPAELSSRFDDQSGSETNSYYAAGSGFAWRSGTQGGMRIDGNDIGASPINGEPGVSGEGYLLVSAEHFTATGIQREVPLTGFSLIIAGHVAQLVLEPAGVLATGNINLPAGGRGKTITILSTQNVTAININPAGADIVVGAPAGLTANTPVTFRFLDDTVKWYRA